MSIPMDPPYCLVYPMSYMRNVEPDHFNTHNNPAGTCLCHCICRATLQYMNDNPNKHKEYAGSHLILPHWAQYKERLFPEILEPQNHREPLTDSATKEPFPMELVGDFSSMDPIFKGCYGNSFLYSVMDLGKLRWHGIHLPLYWSEIPAPLAPSYLQARQPKATKQSPPRATTPNANNLIPVFSSSYAGCFCLVCWFSCSFVSEACACFGEWLREVLRVETFVRVLRSSRVNLKINANNTNVFRCVLIESLLFYFCRSFQAVLQK